MSALGERSHPGKSAGSWKIPIPAFTKPCADPTSSNVSSSQGAGPDRPYTVDEMRRHAFAGLTSREKTRAGLATEARGREGEGRPNPA
jgi:hypothetical protein